MKKLFLISCFALAMGLTALVSSAETLSTQPALPREITVAAAADLKFALEEVIKEYKQLEKDIEIKVTYGSSGNFFAQLSNKAPFDIYLSADIDYPRKLIEKGLAVQGSEFQYATGQIVVWVPTGSKLDVQKHPMEALSDPSLKKIAIANPLHAPYGRAAEAALKTFKIYDDLKAKLVLGENIVQTAQFIETGAADVGIIALSLALSPAMKNKGFYGVVPVDAYPPLVQGGVIMNWAKNPEATKAFRDFISSAKGRAVLKQFGFAQPGA